MKLPDPGSWFRALRVRTTLHFFALMGFLAWYLAYTGTRRGEVHGLVAFGAGFFWFAVITLLVARRGRDG
jgi:hypothetical protein